MQPVRGRPEAILRPSEARQALTVERREPDPALGDLVDYLWSVRWDLGEHVHEQGVMPQPRVHVAAEGGRLLVHGPGGTGAFERRLTGRGLVVGAAFRPAGFRPLLGRSVREVAGRVAPALDLLGHDDRPAGAVAAASGGTDADLDAAYSTLDSYLLALPRLADPLTATVSGWVDHVESEPALTRVDQLADHAGLSPRTLQRLFSEHVGVGAKWVIQRVRLLEVAARVHGGEPVSWADLAAELGFSDQAHLTRSWTAVVGTPPAAYLRRTRSRP